MVTTIYCKSFLRIMVVAIALVLSSCRGPELTTPVSPTPPANLGTPVSTATASSASTPYPNFSHIFIIVMENKEYGQIIGSPSAPYLNQLARTYGLATRYYGVQHPSLPNYLALISGSNQGINDDCPDCTVDAPNLIDQFDAAHITWKAYMQSLPSPCFNGPQAPPLIPTVLSDGYVRRHNPFMYFADIQNNPARCARVVPLTQFSIDLQANSLPKFVWITPDLRYDMHNGTVAEGDQWLSTFVPTILSSQAWKNGGVLFIVWDEGTSNAGCCGVPGGGHIPALVIASAGKRAYQSPVDYTHYSLLKTIEAAWGLPYLGHAGDPTIQPTADFFAVH